MLRDIENFRLSLALPKNNARMQLEMEVRLEIERQVRSALAGPAALIVFDPPGSMYPDVKPALGAAEKFLSQIAIKGDHADAYMRLVGIETRQILEHWRWLVEKLVVELLKCRKMTGADLKSFIEKCSEEGSAEEHGKGSR